MEKDRFEHIKKDLNCIEGGTKEACLIVREYLSNLKTDKSAVSQKDFMEAVEVLMAFGWDNREGDTKPELHYCDNDCSEIDRKIVCAGEFKIANFNKQKTKKLCPYFIDSSNI